MATTAPSFSTPSSPPSPHSSHSASPSLMRWSSSMNGAATGPSGGGANAAKRTLAMNDIVNDDDNYHNDDVGAIDSPTVKTARVSQLATRAERLASVLRGTNSFHSQGHADGELISLQIVHRHGARSPIHPYPKQEVEWKTTGLGAGQLTKHGRAQHEAFGKKLRATYIPNAHSFLPNDSASTDEVYVRSSDVDRCLISVQSLLQGLWPGSRLPVHTIAENTESLLQPTDKCVAYKSNHPIVIKRWSEVAFQKLPDVLKKLKSITGFSIVDDVDTSPNRDDETIEVRAGNLISIMVDNTACSLAQGISIDHYLTPHIIQVLRNFTKDMYFQQYGMNYGGTLDDLHDPRGPSGTQLVRLIRSNFEAKTRDSNVPKRKLSIFSAHDTTLVALASSLGLLRSPNHHLLPPFAASMIFELRKKNDGHYLINALYGHPIAKPDGDLDTADGWEYILEPMSMNCPDLTRQCGFDEWSDRIEKVNPVPSQSSGCCSRSDGFYSLGCDNYTRPFQELPAECQMYRRICPISSCDTNQVMNAATLSCVNIDDGTLDGEPTTAKSIGIGFMAAGAFLCLIAVISRVRNKVPTVRSLDGSTTYAPVLTLRR